MSNDWISRLVVRGPAGDVEAFAKMATDPRIRAHQFDNSTKHRGRLGLSFTALLARLPPGWGAQLDHDITEPWALSLDRPVRLKGGMLERAYRFQLSHYVPDALLVQVSKQYPRLCFVLGWVEPNIDEQASRFIHAGHSSLYRLPEKRKRVLQAGVPADTTGGNPAATDGNDAVLWALVEADWAMMDAVVSHWDRKADLVLRRIRRSSPTKQGTSARRRPGQP